MKYIAQQSFKSSISWCAQHTSSDQHPQPLLPHVLLSCYHTVPGLRLPVELPKLLSSLPPHNNRLDDRFIRSAARCAASREEEVDDQTNDREEEDEETPKKLIQRWATGLEDLNCGKVSTDPGLGPVEMLEKKVQGTY